MCGQESCVPFGCIVGEAIEHVGATNIIFGLVMIFALGLLIGYLIAEKRVKKIYAARSSGGFSD